MINNSEVFNQIAFSLAKHYECVYYVDLDTDHYIVLTDRENGSKLGLPNEGDDFCKDCRRNAQKYSHPDDIPLMRELYNKENMKGNLANIDSERIIIRSISDGKIIHMRHVIILCNDKRHVVCCLENIEKEYVEKENQKKR